MNNKKYLAGIDAGHINTKTVIIRGQEILGHTSEPTRFHAIEAAETSLKKALSDAGISKKDLSGIITTGIFRNLIISPSLNITTSIPEYMADAKGALFFKKNARTVIDIGGNIHKAISFDNKGNIIDVIKNDKCADGMGIFYTTMAKTLGISEQEISELALKSKVNVSVAIQCAICAESEAMDLMCQGVDTADVADAISRFIAGRVAAMCSTISMSPEIVVAGGLAKSQALMKHLQSLLNENIIVLNLPEYTGAIGAVISYGGEK